MIIYQYIFEQLISPFGGLADNDELYEQVSKFEKENDDTGLLHFIQNEIEKSLTYYVGKKFIYSINIKNTYYYYIHCCNIIETTRILESNLVNFKNFNIFYNAINNIYNKMVLITGPTNLACYEMIENDQTGDQIDIFKDKNAWKEYMLA